MKITNIDEYETLVFDCDGVVLNSNKVKTQAFFDATKHYGEDMAQKLVDYHVENGGISRYIKMEYFLTDILGKELEQKELDDLLSRFAVEVKQGLMNCEIAEGLEELREKTKNSNWLIVSGGYQEELREVFKERNLDKFFDGGIFGSPDDKDTILAREINNQNIRNKALFLGDSKYDMEAAKNANLDFLFISDWTEVNRWREWSTSKKIHAISGLTELIGLEFIRDIQVYLKDGATIPKDMKILNKGVNNKLILSKNSTYGSMSGIRIEFIGSNNIVYLSEDANIKRGHHRLVGNANELHFGKKTTVENAYFLLDGKSKIILGDDCMLSCDIEFRTTDAHSLIDIETNKVINSPESIILGDHIWVGKGALIMQGVTLCSNLVVGTRSVVTKSFNEEFCAIAGVAAKIVKKNIGWKRESPSIN